MYKVIIENRKFDVAKNTSIEDLINVNLPDISCVAAIVNDKKVDLSSLIEEDSSIKIIKASDPDGLEVIRHTCAHVFGHALKQIYPNAKMVIGPTIDNGFYYDIHNAESISEKDLKSIESLMKKLSKKKKSVVNEKNLSKNLQTKDIPDPDLLIRTGNTKRLSNFLLWQLAYSEIFFEKKLWPAFNEKDYNRIIKEYKNIKRNFGKI